VRLLFLFVSLLLIEPTLTLARNFNAPNRIKDIVNFEGIRENILVGYGLVVGLNGTGDNLTNSNFTNQGLNDFLSKMGVNVKGANLKTKNIAAVTVTATLPAFARQGGKIDINTSTIGDAKSLVGGTLLATPLLGADGEVYAVAQGQVSIAGFESISNRPSVTTRAVATNGFITNGAIIEREIDFQLDSLSKIKLSLKNPDISTAVEIANIINSAFLTNIAKAIDPSTVELQVNDIYKNNVVGLLAKIENIEINTDTRAKIIIEESSGTVTIGENVRISPVAVSQGNLSVKIEPSESKNKKKAEERGSQIREINQQSTLSQLVEGLNALGVMPRDLISILENIKASGALQADIEVR
jgi:flagellar P-ring protein FlgI